MALSGAYGLGEVVSVDLDLTDIDTNSSDYGDFLAAVQTAADNNPNVTFDGISTLTFTSPSDGASMADLLIDLPIENDTFIEGDEDFQLALSGAASSTGATVGIDTAADSVTTTISDTDGVGGDPDGPAEWSIVGTTSVDEGASASYTVSLTGTYGVGEEVSVVVDLTNIDTNSTDYQALDTALALAAGGNADVSYDSATNTLTYTSPSDGASLTPLTFFVPIVDDVLIEGPEDYSIVLSSASSTTGIAPTIDVASVTTTIDDTQGPNGCLLYTSPSPRDRG